MVEIRIGHIQNTGKKYYRLSQLVRPMRQVKPEELLFQTAAILVANPWRTARGTRATVYILLSTPYTIK